MPPSLAASLWFFLLLLLFRFDPVKDQEASPALWVAVTWLCISGSRLPSQWLGIQSASLTQALEEGSALDRTIECFIIALAIGILLSRSFPWHRVFIHNAALIAYLSFALFSILWSDFAWVSFKRWFRDLGNYIVILIVLSDPRPAEAVCTVLRRVAYLLIPLSILLIKYYAYLGINYDEWTGLASYVGVTTSKNMLGALCLVSGVFFFWDLVTHWSDRHQQRGTWLFVDISFIVMTLWLLRKAHSATATACFLLGCLVIIAAHSKNGQRHSAELNLVIPSSFLLYLIVGFGFRLNEQIAALMGRDPTLTGRTEIWSTLLSMNTNPILGTGYESFWLGSRLSAIWELRGRITEAHNGYLEIYLNLGITGVLLFVAFLTASYRRIANQRLANREMGSLALALWTVMVFYMVTEAGFRGGLLSIVFLLAVMYLTSSADTTRMPQEGIEQQLAFEAQSVVSAE